MTGLAGSVRRQFNETSIGNGSLRKDGCRASPSGIPPVFPAIDLDAAGMPAYGHSG